MTDFTQYVHEYTGENGETLYTVAEWDHDKAQFTRPMDSTEHKLTGCFLIFSRTAKGMSGTFRDRKRALRRARYLFGDERTT